MNRLATSLVCITVLLAACGPVSMGRRVAATSEPRTLTVFAASSLTEAFTEIGKSFETENPNVTVNINFAGSGTLRTQLEQGAAADVFASANQAEMNTLENDNLIAEDSVKVFLTNSLLVILPSGNPASIQVLVDLASPGIKLVLGDTTVPAGKYARQILSNMDRDPIYPANFSSQVLANVVSNETNVKQVVAKVQLGEADAGIVYLSDAIASPGLKTIEFPPADNLIAKYPIALLLHSSQATLGERFIAYVLSANGQAILKKWGFVPVIP